MTTVPSKRAVFRRTPATKTKAKKATPPAGATTNVGPTRPVLQQPPVPSAAHEADRLSAWAEPKATSLVELRARAEDDSLDSVFQKHLVDFRTAFAEMRKQAPSVVFFGGARLQVGDGYYDLAMSFGAQLAQRGIPPKTGAGPGAMHAVPAGFIEERERLPQRLAQHVVAGMSRLAHLDDQRTLGFNIHLPAEQKVSPAIENAQEIQLFAFRKFALYENVRGVVVFPGGFGTLDELFEVLVLAHEGKTRDPIVLAGKNYWQPIVEAWRSSAQRNGQNLIAGMLDNVLITDDPRTAMDFVEGRTDVRAFESEPAELYQRMVRELKLARYVATRQEKAVTFIGGNQLAADDPALTLARLIAEHVAGQGTPVRVGDDGNGTDAVALGAGTVQRVRWDPHPTAVHPTAVHSTAVHPTAVQRTAVQRTAVQRTEARKRHHKHAVDDVTFSERIPHKETLLRNSSAYVVLPDAARGHDELTTVLCQIQTGKLPRRPLLLVDSGYWRPIVESWERAMVSEHHAYIAPEDMQLLRFVDSLDQAKAALDGTAV